MFSSLTQFVEFSYMCAAGVVVFGLLLIVLWRWIEYKNDKGDP